MKITLISAAVLAWQSCAADPSLVKAPQHTLLQLQRVKQHLPTAFSGPAGSAQLNLTGFCDRPDKKPACDQKPCCCWSTWAADKHPTYPNEDEVKSKQECRNPGAGYQYAPDPGLTYNDGYFDTLKMQGYPVYAGRRLCCLRRAKGVQEESQRDLRMAVKTTTTTAVKTTPAAGVAVPAAFTTEILTTSLLNPGDEYETAQMETAARAHLLAADNLFEAVHALNQSAIAIGEVNTKLQTDPNLLRSRQNVANMKAAINAWVAKRWENLGKLKSGDASAFSNAGA